MGGGGITQAQLDRLFTAALEAAIARIETDGSFFPLVFEMRSGGIIHNVAVLETGSIDGRADVLERQEDVLASRAVEGVIQAAALVIHLPDQSAIEARLRAANFSSNLHVAYTVRGVGLIRRMREVTLGQIIPHTVHNRIF